MKLRKSALSALLAAAGTVILALGSLWGRIDLAAAVLASVCVAVAAEETDAGHALAVYAVIAVLALLLLPQKTAAVLFTAFFGYYPVLKAASERRLGVLGAYLAKFSAMNLALAGLLIAACFAVKVHIFVMLCAFAVCNVLLPLYDFAVTRVTLVYRARRFRGGK